MLTRSGGEKVYVCDRHRSVILQEPYRRLLRQNPKARTWGWRVMRRNAGVYVAGRIRHPDHKTIELEVWHEVAMNTESRAPAMRHVAFLD